MDKAKNPKSTDNIAKECDSAGTVPKARRGRPSRARSEQITDQILDLAAAMFQQLGYDRASMEAIAQQAGIPKTTLYKRFSDKADVLQAVIASRMSRWSAENTRRDEALPQDFAERLTHHMASLLIWTTNPEVRSIARLAANLPDAPAQGFSGRSLWGYKNMHDVIAKTIVDYGPQAGVQAQRPDFIADMLMALAGGTVAMRSTSAQMELIEANQIAGEMVRCLINGAQDW